MNGKSKAPNHDEDVDGSQDEEPLHAATSSAASSNNRAPSDKKGTAAQDVDPSVHEERFNKLKFLLQRSSVYSRIMGEKMEKERKARAEAAAKR